MATSWRRTKVPETKWDQYKEEIKKLYLINDYTLNAVAEEMKGRLDASPSQFEAQLKAWGFRKNLTKQEWTLIFTVIDELPRGVKTRVIISGCPISDSKIQRARRNYKSLPSGNSKRRGSQNDAESDEVQAISDLADVLIQIQSSGTWSTLPTAGHCRSIGNAERHDAHSISEYSEPTLSYGEHYTSALQHNSDTDPLLQVETSNSLENSSGTKLDSRFESSNLELSDAALFRGNAIAQRNTKGFISDFVPEDATNTTTPMESLNFNFNEGIPVQPTSNITVSGPCMGNANLMDPRKSLGLENQSGLDVEPYVSPNNQHLPTRSLAAYSLPIRVMGNEETRLHLSEPDALSDPSGIMPQFAASSWYPQISLIISSMVLPSAEIIVQVIKVYSNTTMPNPNLAWQLSADINADHFPTTTTLTSGLTNLFTLQNFVGERQVQLATLPRDIAYETRLYTRLIVLVVNGFPGRRDISAAGVLRFLKRHQTIQFLITRFIGSCSSLVAISLAKNIFEAAIEADDVDIIKYLLDHTAIDLNETVCIRHGDRYTPIEMAAYFQSIGVIEYLISQNVDMNKSYTRVPNSDILSMLIYYNRNHQSTFNEGYLNVVNVLLEKTTTIRVFHIVAAFQRFTDPRLAITLITKSTFQRLNSPRDLVVIFGHLRRLNFTNLIPVIIAKCRGPDGNDPLASLSVDDALHTAILRGYKELVEIFLPHTRNINIALQKAVQSGNQTIICLIYQNSLRLNEEGCLGSFISALHSGDQTRLHLLEEEGALSYIKDSHFVGQALSLALIVGNFEYATKILNVDPTFDFIYERDPTFAFIHERTGKDLKFDVSVALNAAFAHNFDDIAWELLALGVTTALQCLMPLLYVAITNRKPDFVKAIIESGFDPSLINRSDGDWSVLEAALEWGNESILSDIWQAHSYKISPSKRLLTLALQKGPPNLFWDILASDTGRLLKYWNEDGSEIPVFWGATAVSTAISTENILLLDELAAFGVKLEDGEILLQAIENHPSMIRPLLERYRKDYPHGLPKFSRDAIRIAIEVYDRFPQYLDMLFELNLVTTAVLDGDGEGPTPLAIALECFELRNQGPPGRDIHLIRRLLDANCNVNSIMEANDAPYGQYTTTTALLTAIEMREMDVVQLLIQYGAEINKPARFGLPRTPLQAAAEMDDSNMVGLLLSSGANPNAEPARFSGATALQYAALNGNLEIAKVLIEHGAHLNVPPPQGFRGRWPLEGAAETGRLDMIHFLWELNGHPFDDKQCKKAMRLAERNGHLGCKMLIEQLMASSQSMNFPMLDA